MADGFESKFFPIVATLLLGVAARAGQTAREARTKQLVARIHTLLMEKYESYRTARVELNAADRNTNQTPDWRDLFLVDTAPPSDQSDNAGLYSLGEFETGNRTGLLSAAGRLAAIRELIKMEMPDRWSDVLLVAVQDPPTRVDRATLQTTPLRPQFVEERPSLNTLYLRR
ncbi:MAG: hypothetical protein AAGA56_25090, partial [Myxococcota bacterium]